ncbi:MAG: AAA family ATPase [Micromonosporaceae bacterium]|nr:AAA family ATPase [Micromonosporaceae bacterium]
MGRELSTSAATGGDARGAAPSQGSTGGDARGAAPSQGSTGGDARAATPGQGAAEEIAAEQRHLDVVYARLEVLKKEAAAVEAAGHRIARVGNYGALVERDAMVYHAARRRRLLDSEHEGLVFGRLDLRGGEIRYIGRLGLRDEHAGALVIDWRAPAAAPFYRATPVEPMRVIRRRIIQSSGERVTGVEDDLLDPAAAPPDLRVIGDGALVATLARATGTGMRDIVATIQKEQDEAIRSPALGVTWVRGGPGTGKTAVALHRAAYLLYSDRQRFAGGGVLVIGPSAVFVNYISRVLPSLGEDEATLRSLGSLVVNVEATRHDPPEVAAVKGSLRMVPLLRRAARDAVPGSPDELRLLYRGTLLRLSTRELRQLRHTVLAPGVKRNAARAKAAGYLLDALWRQAVSILGEAATPAREQFAGDVAERREFTTFMRTWWPRLRPADVLGWLADPARLNRYRRGLLEDREYSALLRPGDTDLSVQDVPLLDELDELLGSPPVPRRRPVEPFTVDGVREVTTYADRMAARRRVAVQRPADYREYAHIVVDEAQDVTPMQWRMIGRRGEYASWTVVGDPAQSAWSGDPEETRRARDEALRGRRRREYLLTTNYRNSAEIFELAASVVRRVQPDAQLPVPVRHTGVPPRDVLTGDVAAAVPQEVRRLLADVEGTVGVVSTQDTRDEVAGWLAGIPDPRLQVVNSLEAKGMEYDAVLVVEPAAIAGESAAGARTLYVALSRATQRLTTVGSDPSWR